MIFALLEGREHCLNGGLLAPPSSAVPVRLVLLQGKGPLPTSVPQREDDGRVETSVTLCPSHLLIHYIKSVYHIFNFCVCVLS